MKLSLSILFSILLGCQEKSNHVEIEPSNQYHNSQINSHIKAITIEESDSSPIIRIIYSDKEKKYVGYWHNDEIIVELENGHEYHLYKNGTYELRLYRVLSAGNPLEDIEWTFYNHIE